VGEGSRFVFDSISLAWYHGFMDEYNEERIKNLVDSIEAGCTKLGLYLIEANVATSDEGAVGQEEVDLRESLADEESVWMVQAVFSIGDVAFSDRVQNPKKFEEDKEFREVMPTEAELLREKYLETLKNGADILSVFDDEDDEEDE